MRVLRPGLSGEDVEAWQLFLRGQGEYMGEADGKYEGETIAASTRWQKQQGLLEDAVIGPKTFAKAQELGYNPGFSDSDASDRGPSWPPRPTFAPLDDAARRKVLGSFDFRATPTSANPEAIEILGTWVENHIHTVDIPELASVQNAPAGGKLRLHERAVEPFRKFFAAVDAAGLRDRLLSFGGAWTPRLVRGSRTSLSNHAYGAAIDLNVPWNGLGVMPAYKGKKGSVRELVPIANEFGIYWGGHFSRRADGMHFELASPAD